MIAASVDLELAVHGIAELRLGQHALDGFLDDADGIELADDLHAVRTHAAFVAAVRAVDLLIFLASGEADPAGVDDHDEITSIERGRPAGLVFSLEEASG